MNGPKLGRTTRRALAALSWLLLLMLLVALGAWIYSQSETPTPGEDPASLYPETAPGVVISQSNC